MATKWVGLEILGFSEFQLFVLATFSVLGPVISQAHYDGATTWAIVASVSGVGALLGDAISLRMRPRFPLLVAGAFTLGDVVILLALAFAAPLPVLIACSGSGLGIGFSIPDTLWFTAMQDNVPENLIARVSAFDWMGSTALRPIGLADASRRLPSWWGAPAVLFVAAGIYSRDPRRGDRASERSRTPRGRAHRPHQAPPEAPTVEL